MQTASETDEKQATAKGDSFDPDGNPVISWGNGRTMTLKEPGVLASFDLVALLGAKLADNAVYTAMCFPLIYLDKIDGQTEMYGNLMEMRNLIQRLGTDGLKALREGVSRHFGKGSEADEKANIKNG